MKNAANNGPHLHRSLPVQDLYDMHHIHRMSEGRVAAAGTLVVKCDLS